MPWFRRDPTPLMPSEGGLTTKKLILDMIEAARELSRQPGTYWTDQLNNHDSIAGYDTLGEEIWSQTEGRVDAFVHCVGTGASSRGVATSLKRDKPGVGIVAVEPAESSVLLGGQPGPHKIEGVGIGYIPPLWEPSLVDAGEPGPAAVERAIQSVAAAVLGTSESGEPSDRRRRRNRASQPGTAAIHGAVESGEPSERASASGASGRQRRSAAGAPADSPATRVARARRPRAPGEARVGPPAELVAAGAAGGRSGSRFEWENSHETP